MLREKLMLIVLLVTVAGTAAVADVEIIEERNGDMIIEILKCRDRNDLKDSRLPGFVEVMISSKMKDEVRYLPVDNIGRIVSNDDGVYITWGTERRMDKKGFITTVIYVPEEVRSPERVIELLRDAVRSK